MGFFTGGGSQVGSAQINDNSIVNADINSAAAIERRKLASGLVLRVTKSANQALGAEAQITFDTEAVDTLTAFASNVFTAPRAMNVIVVLNAHMTSGGSSVREGSVAVRKNGAVVRICGWSSGDTGGGLYGATVVEVLTLAQNDTIDCVATSNGAEQALVSGATATTLTVCEM